MRVFEKYKCPATCVENVGEITDFLAGLECEIESIKQIGLYDGFSCTEDGSLRNGGKEFVSHPASKNKLLENFKRLHDGLILGEDPFSSRTSTHVHVNVASMEMTQLKGLVMLYALFEELFFMMVKPERRDNIHCVPLTETYMPSVYGKGIDTMITNWHKYTALNLKRVIDLGTVEFRHLHGTNDVEELRQWLSTIENLWNLAKKEEINKKSLTMSSITKWFEYIFADAPKILSLKPTLLNIIANNLIDVKLSF